MIIFRVKYTLFVSICKEAMTQKFLIAKPALNFNSWGLPYEFFHGERASLSRIMIFHGDRQDVYAFGCLQCVAQRFFFFAYL